MTAILDSKTSDPLAAHQHSAPGKDVSPQHPEPDRAGDRALWPSVLAGLVVFVPAMIAGALVWQVVGSGTAPLFVVDDGGAVSRIDPGQNSPAYTIDNATVSPDGRAIFATEPTPGDNTTVRQVDVDNGETVAEVELDGQRRIAVVAPHANAVALVPPGTISTEELYEPVPRSTTELDILFTDDRPAKSFALAGNFEPETFNRDATVLYLLEFFPAEAPDRYFVRQLDIESGEITEVYSPNVELSPEMRGKARAQVLAPDFSFMYTLYTLEPDAKPLTDPTAQGDQNRWAFIHVLSLEEDWSFCIFLPVPIGTTAQVELSMAISPDGQFVYVVDRFTQTIAVVHTATNQVVNTAEVDLWDGSGPPEHNVPVSTVTNEGNLLTTTRSGIQSFGQDLESPEKFWWHDPESTVVDLQSAKDVNQVQVAFADGRIIVYDLDRDVEVATLVAPGDGTGFVGPPGSAVTLSLGNLECAC